MQPAFTVWCTGLPSSGKEALARMISELCTSRGQETTLFLSPALRAGGPSDATVQRDIQTSQSHMADGRISVVSAESPRTTQRNNARQTLTRFIEVYVATPKESCIDGDDSGYWKKALNGELRNFPGVDHPYEVPTRPDISVDLSIISIDEAMVHCASAFEKMGLLQPIAQ